MEVSEDGRRGLKRGCSGSRSLEEVITRSSSIVEVSGEGRICSLLEVGNGINQSYVRDDWRLLDLEEQEKNL